MSPVQVAQTYPTSTSLQCPTARSFTASVAAQHPVPLNRCLPCRQLKPILRPLAPSAAQLALSLKAAQHPVPTSRCLPRRGLNPIPHPPATSVAPPGLPLSTARYPVPLNRCLPSAPQQVSPVQATQTFPFSLSNQRRPEEASPASSSVSSDPQQVSPVQAAQTDPLFTSLQCRPASNFPESGSSSATQAVQAPQTFPLPLPTRDTQKELPLPAAQRPVLPSRDLSCRPFNSFVVRCKRPLPLPVGLFKDRWSAYLRRAINTIGISGYFQYQRKRLDICLLSLVYR